MTGEGFACIVIAIVFGVLGVFAMIVADDPYRFHHRMARKRGWDLSKVIVDPEKHNEHHRIHLRMLSILCLLIVVASLMGAGHFMSR